MCAAPLCVLPVQVNERVSADPRDSCVADCALPFLLCPPFDSTSPPCNGLGVCHNSIGACICTKGYIGPDCSLCAAGFKRVNGFCIAAAVLAPPRIGSGSNLLVVPADQCSLFSSKSAVIGVSVTVVLLMLLCAFWMSRMRQKACVKAYDADMAAAALAEAAN